VQDLYVKLLEFKNINKIMYKQDVNLFYLYKMLKSIHLNGIKKQTNNVNNANKIEFETIDIEILKKLYQNTPFGYFLTKFKDIDLFWYITYYMVFDTCFYDAFTDLKK
jgi:hypothetical protein